jgi:hypothetical protein
LVCRGPIHEQESPIRRREEKLPQRTHLAATPDPIILREVVVENEPFDLWDKPQGFWYEVDGDWRRWKAAREAWECRHLHTVFLNDCNILLIDTDTKFTDFHDEYKAEPNYLKLTESKILPIRYGIDWPRVAQRYDGIEIAPYLYRQRHALERFWYYTWDCASGVIWRPKNATVTYLGEWEKQQ